MTREEMIAIKEKRGYSFAQLSEYTGVPAVTLQKIFSGKTRQPRQATLDAIVRVLTGEETVYQGKAYEYETGGYGFEDRRWEQEASVVREPAAAYGEKRKKQGEYTLEDYYALPEERRAELIDGVIYDMSSPRVVHQDISAIIHMSIYEFIRKNKGSCKTFAAPVDVQLDCDDRTMVQPDVLIVCDRDKIREFGIYGAPDFVLEILSEATRGKDMTVKLSKYLGAGVKEYWIIDPKKKTLITYNFMDQDWLPCVHPLEGEAGLALFDGALKIDLTEIAKSIEEFG